MHIHTWPPCDLQEDVIYALNESDAWADIQTYNSKLNKGKGFRAQLPGDPSKLCNANQVLYLMKSDDTPTPTMTYLRSVYCRSVAKHSTVDQACLPSRCNQQALSSVWQWVGS